MAENELKRVTVTQLDGFTVDAEMNGYHMVMDSPIPSGAGRGPSPIDVTLAGLAACTAFDVITIMRKSRQPMTGLVVRAEARRAEDHPRRFTEVELIYEVQGEGVDRAMVERAVELSEKKYCSVSGTFQERTVITTRIEMPTAGN